MPAWAAELELQQRWLLELQGLSGQPAWPVESPFPARAHAMAA